MNFKNLSFIQHPNINNAIMAQVICNNGKRVSVVAGKGLYSTSKAGVKEECNKVEEAVSFEVMVGDEGVIGWQTREDIDKILKENNG
jgi:hypothetical protein|tara:strand:- start:69 stop:329 length:261 start_codon:yes stop_codon:yes gene_type:complete